MTDFAARVDALTIDDLRSAGSLKWTAYPDAIGAWVAEMDFGLAPAVAAALDEIDARRQTGYAPLRQRTQPRASQSRGRDTLQGLNRPLCPRA